MKGLFSTEELNADNVKDKDSKLAFLQKLVDYLSIVHGYVISVRIMSIIAGKEADKTNEMLQLLAEIVNKKVDNIDCVMRTQRGDARQLQPRNQLKTPDVQKRTSDGGHKNAQQAGTGGDNKGNVLEDKNQKRMKRDRAKIDTNNKSSVLNDKTDEVGEKALPVDVKMSPGEHKGRSSRNELDGRHSTNPTSVHGRNSQQSGRSSVNVEKPIRDEGVELTQNGKAESPGQSRLSRPASAKHNRSRKEESTSLAQSITDESKGDIQPSARLAPPRPRRTVDEVVEDQTKITSSTGAVVTGLIIPESHQDSDDEDDAQFVIEETVCAGTNLGSANRQSGELLETQEHGGLVSKMLQSKKEFEAGNAYLQPKSDSQAQVHGQIDEATRQRERVQIEKDMEKLCTSLQALSRSALPLGKLMDFVQEDLESMQQEFERWTNEYDTLQCRLREEESLTQSSIDPLQAQLTELECYGNEQHKAIASFKAKLLVNDERIQDMLSRSLEKVH